MFSLRAKGNGCSIQFLKQSQISGGSRGRRRRAPPNAQNLSFLHTNFPQCYRVGPWHPPYGVGTPLREILDLSLQMFGLLNERPICGRTQKLIFLQSVDFGVDFMKSGRFQAWNPADFMKFSGFHEIWQISHEIHQISCLKTFKLDNSRKKLHFTERMGGGGAMSFELCEICRISWNLLNFMKSAGFHTKDHLLTRDGKAYVLCIFSVRNENTWPTDHITCVEVNSFNLRHRIVNLIALAIKCNLPQKYSIISVAWRISDLKWTKSSWMYFPKNFLRNNLHTTK